MRFTCLLNLTPLFKATGYEGYDMTVCVCVGRDIERCLWWCAYAVRRVLVPCVVSRVLLFSLIFFFSHVPFFHSSSFILSLGRAHIFPYIFFLPCFSFSLSLGRTQVCCSFILVPFILVLSFYLLGARSFILSQFLSLLLSS